MLPSHRAQLLFAPLCAAFGLSCAEEQRSADASASTAGPATYVGTVDGSNVYCD
jgi:hypothetical protein